MPCGRSAATSSTRTRRCSGRRSPTPATRSARGSPRRRPGSAATARGLLVDPPRRLRGAARRGRSRATRQRLRRSRRRRAERAGRQRPPARRPRSRTTCSRFRAAPLIAAEQVRRAGQLERFLGLVPIEYGRGVADGTRVVPTSRSRRRSRSATAPRSPSATSSRISPAATSRRRARVQRALGELDARLGDAARGDGGRRPRARSRRSRGRRRRRSTTSIPEDWKEARPTADFDVIADDARPRAGRSRPPATWRRAESGAPRGVRASSSSARSSGSAGLAPSLFQRVEGLFWYGADGARRPRAARQAQNASADELAETMAALDARARANRRGAIGAGPQSRVSVVTNSAIIVFREGLEAVLILAALMASMVGAQRRLPRPLLAGVGIALVGERRHLGRRADRARLARRLRRAARGGRLAGRDRRAAPDPQLVLPPGLLAGEPPGPPPEEEARARRRVDRDRSPRRLSGSCALGFSSVYREGFETVLFLQALTLEAGAWTVLQGVALGFAGVRRRLRARRSRSSAGCRTRRCSIATGLLITWVLVVLVGTTVQTHAGRRLDAASRRSRGSTLPYWAGLWFGVFPTWEGLLPQAAALVVRARQLRRVGGAQDGGRRRRILAAPVAVAYEHGRVSARPPRRDGRAPARSASPTRARPPWASRGPRRRPIRGRCRQSRVRASRPRRPAPS